MPDDAPPRLPRRSGRCATAGPVPDLRSSLPRSSPMRSLIGKIFGALGARVTASVPTPPGYSDDFLIKADKNPNTARACRPVRPGRLDAADIIDEASKGESRSCGSSAMT